MQRKNYVKPATLVVILRQRIPLLSGSPKGDLDGDEDPEGEDWD